MGAGSGLALAIIFRPEYCRHHVKILHLNGIIDRA